MRLYSIDFESVGCVSESLWWRWPESKAPNMAGNQTGLGVRLIAGDLANWLESFIMDKRSTGLSPRSIEFYRTGLSNFLTFATLMGAKDVQNIDANMIRRYLLSLENQGYTAGGVHAKWRAVRAFFNWLELELADADWRNPVTRLKVRPPKLDPLDPADIDAVKALLADCSKPDRKYLAARDKAILLFLLDTGVRASELLSLTVQNVNPITGVVQVVHGKGGKSRTVYIGRKSKRALRAYLKEAAPDDWLWLNVAGDRLTRNGLHQMLKRRAKSAGVKVQSAHSFRRLFALTMLRNGVDIYSLQLLMGHADTQVLRRYLKLTQNDTLEAHIKGSPVEKLL